MKEIENKIAGLTRTHGKMGTFDRRANRPIPTPTTPSHIYCAYTTAVCNSVANARCGPRLRELARVESIYINVL